MNGKVLIAYESKRGATEEIAKMIGEVIRKNGTEADVIKAGKVRDLSQYDTIVIGSAVYIGLWRRDAVKFIRQFENQLMGLSVWIFSSGPTGEGDPMAITDGWCYPESLRSSIESIKPKGVICFGGKIDVKGMGLFDKMIINNVKAPVGDFRNWDEIESWAEKIC